MCLTNQYVHFWVHGHSSWSTFGLHLVKDPKAFYFDFLRVLTMEVGPLTKAIFHGSEFMVHGVNRPYVHSNLSNIMHVATKVHVILRRYAVLAWMHDNK